MPNRYHVTRRIEAPVERPWSILTDAGRYTEWNPTIIRLDGEIALGRTIELVSTVNPKRAFNLTVTELSAPNRMVWSDGMPIGLFQGERTYLLREAGGATEFSMTEEFTGLLSRLISKSIPDMAESFNQFADGLKRAAETSTARDPSAVPMRTLDKLRYSGRLTTSGYLSGCQPYPPRHSGVGRSNSP